MGASFYGSASCVDATGYELYVIASAVVGGASLSGGKGSAVSAMLGALLIVLIRQSIRTLHFDQNYEWIIIGCAIIVAVVLDQASARFTARRLARAAEQVRPRARHGTGLGLSGTIGHHDELSARRCAADCFAVVGASAARWPAAATGSAGGDAERRRAPRRARR